MLNLLALAKILLLSHLCQRVYGVAHSAHDYKSRICMLPRVGLLALFCIVFLDILAGEGTDVAVRESHIAGFPFIAEGHAMLPATVVAFPIEPGTVIAPKTGRFVEHDQLFRILDLALENLAANPRPSLT